ncbi:MAG: AIR synthase-related protein [Promethearchaeota archaeon]
MSDLEGLTRRLMNKGYDKEYIIERLVKEYMDFKDIEKNSAISLAEAIYEECKKSDVNSISDHFIKHLLDFNKAHVSVGKQGVGCRGKGDFFVHKLIGELSKTNMRPFLSPSSLDDAGAVKLSDISIFNNADYEKRDLIIVSKMEGIHSRLSDFPFICGFHVTRAALRDLYVKGAKPISVMIDTHLGDDADVGKLFDFMAGVSVVCELARVPITAGSTLRIGGDMVIGDRFVGGVAAIGLALKRILARRNIQPGDVILMTEGAGGGTIATTSIYSGNHDVIRETLNIKFLKACEIILRADYVNEIRAMCDVTNGGLRGDLYEINYESGCGVIIYEKEVKKLVNERVLKLLEDVGVDYLGVSLDALLIYCSKNVSERIINDINANGIKCSQIGIVDDSKGVHMIFENNQKETILPRFRESAYTKVKQKIGEEDPEEMIKWEKKIEEAARKALEKREKIIQYIRDQ